MNAWLKAMGMSDAPCTGWKPHKRGHIDFDDNHNGAGIKVGDRLVLYAVGRDAQIFAIAEVTFASRRWGDSERYPWRCFVRPIAVCPVESAPLIYPIWAPDVFTEGMMQGSYVRLTPQRYEAAERAILMAPGVERFD